MSDGVNVDFGQLQAPNYVGDYANAFRVGRQMAQARGEPQMNAFNLVISHRADLNDQIASLSPEGRNVAARRAEIFTALGQGLAGRPYEERRAIIGHLAPQLVEQGLPAAALAGFDPSDANLAAAIGQAGALQRALTAPSPADSPNAMRPGLPPPPGE